MPAPVTAPVEALNGLALDAQGAAAGEERAFGSLETSLKELKAAAAASPDAPFAKDERYNRIVSNASAVLQARGSLADAGLAVREARDIVSKLLAEVGTLASGLSGPTLDAASRALERFEVRAQRLQLDVATLGDGVSPTRARLLSDWPRARTTSVRSSRASRARTPASASRRPRARRLPQRLQTINQLYTDLGVAVRSAVNAAPALPAAQAAAQAVTEDARGSRSRRVAQLRSSDAGLIGLLPVALAAAVLLVVLALWFGIRALRDTVDRHRLALETQRKETDRNQQAILRLLDELSSLADGDLTVQATVTEDITGAIADSINYAVDALRGLVTTINQSAIHLDSAARQTQALSAHLAKASGAQSKQIASATESAGGMASATEEVSGNAERAADVARHSVEVAHKGGDAVRRTIDGMNTIRETIQVTSKRIKRLGESSQEIGNIVELINDIAEQTNILALERLDPGLDGRRSRPRLRGRCRRSAAPRRARRQRDQADRSARAHDSDGYERSRRLDGAQYDRRGGRCSARRERRCRAGRDRAGVEPDCEPRAEHLRQLASADLCRAEHRAEHAGAQRDQLADRRFDERHICGHCEACRAVLRAA